MHAFLTNWTVGCFHDYENQRCTNDWSCVGRHSHFRSRGKIILYCGIKTRILFLKYTQAYRLDSNNLFGVLQFPDRALHLRLGKTDYLLWSICGAAYCLAEAGLGCCRNRYRTHPILGNWSNVFALYGLPACLTPQKQVHIVYKSFVGKYLRIVFQGQRNTRWQLLVSIFIVAMGTIEVG